MSIDKMKLKIQHYVGLLILLTIIVSGYFLLQQQKPAVISPKFGQYASELGLDVDQFSTCLTTNKYNSEIQSDISDGKSYGVEGTPTFFINGKNLVGAVPLENFKSIIDSELSNPSANPQIGTGTNPPLGSANANVTIVEFSDYQCPFCAKAELTLKQILQDYEGKVKIYYRDFPLNFHKLSYQAAEASKCAGEQGKYWEYHDILFDRQQEWSGE